MVGRAFASKRLSSSLSLAATWASGSSPRWITDSRRVQIWSFFSAETARVSTRSYLEEAEAALAKTDMVITGALDGGYVLLGLRKPMAAVFEAIPWSSDSVFSATLGRARAAGLTYECLSPLEDVDDLESYERQRDDDSRPPEGIICVVAAEFPACAGRAAVPTAEVPRHDEASSLRCVLERRIPMMPLHSACGSGTVKSMPLLYHLAFLKAAAARIH